MIRQIMIMAVVEDDWESDDELHRVINDVLVHKHGVCIIVEDIVVTQENYDWKTANGVQEEEE